MYRLKSNWPAEILRNSVNFIWTVGSGRGSASFPEEWISQSTAIHMGTNEANLRNPNYNYLWSRHSFEAEGEEIQGFQLRVRADSFCSYFRN
jgi:hypothetical protein